MRFAVAVWCAVLLLLVAARAGAEELSGALDLGVPVVPEKAEAMAHPSVAEEFLKLASEADAKKRHQMARAASIDLVGDSVRAVVELRQPGEDRAFLDGYGARVECACGVLVQALVPLGRLFDLAADERVAYVRPPLRPVRSGVAPLGLTSEALEKIGGAEYHRAGFKGRGVDVAVIDRSFNGYWSNPELPAANIAEARSFRSDGRMEDYGDPWGGHGTACAEVILDVAPEARLHLLAVGTDVEFGAAVDYAIGKGIPVISLSMEWVRVPLDGTGFLCDVVNRARHAGIFFAASAGNRAQCHYEGYFRDSDGDGWHEFAPGDEGLSVGYVAAGTSLDAVLSWDDWPRAFQDYDLYLYRADAYGNLNLVSRSAQLQAGVQPPVESISYVPVDSGRYFFAVRKYSASRNARLELFTSLPIEDHNVPESSITSPADAAGAVAVGAVAWDTDRLEDYSSRGPTNDGRVKPDLAGPTGVSTFSYGPGGFGGTSAATPHVAGAAALLKSADPALTVEDLRRLLEGEALDLGAPGKDNLYGAGRLRLPPPGLVAGDTVPPEVAFTDPIPGAAGVPVDKTVLVTFTEDVQPGTAYGNIALKDPAGVPVPVQIAISGPELTIDPLEPLLYETTYSVTIPAGAVVDLAGNALAQEYTFSFTTQSGTGGGGGGGPVTVPPVVLALPTVTATPGGTVTLPLTVGNAADAAGFQFTVGWDAPWLTEPRVEKGALIAGDPGWTLAAGWDGGTLAGQYGGDGFPLNPLRPGELASVRQMSYHWVEVIVYHTGGQPLGSTEGELLKLSFKVAQNAPAGAAEDLRFTAATVSDAGGQSLPVTTQDGRVTVAARKKGDANGDGVVNVLDVVRTVNIALGRIQPTDEERYAADANGDGVINVLDVVRIVNIALGRT